MAWDNNNNDPWNKNNKSDTPPDLDELLNNLNKNIKKFFGGGGSGSEQGSNSGKIGSISVGFLLAIVAGLWAVSGFFVVGPAEEAVVTRFGKYRDTFGPGLSWIPRFIDSKQIIDTQNVYDLSYRSMMLTQDENIVFVELAVQYRIGDPQEFLFNVVNPVESLQQATASALRHVIGHTPLSDILTTGREEVRSKVRTQLSSILDRYATGLVLMDVVMQPATPPEEVKEAFDDAIKAQEDEQRYKNQAYAYEREVVPQAQGKAKRLLEAANAYKKRTILAAKGDVAKFAALLPEYRQAPYVTKQRLYLDTMEHVLSQSSKVILDSKGSNNLTYLPLDKILAQGKDNNDANSYSAKAVLQTNKNVATNTKIRSGSNDTYRAGRQY